MPEHSQNMGNLSFDYLDDGQISASVRQWRERLCGDRDGVLSVCRQIGGVRIGEAFDDALLKASTSVRESFFALLSAIGQAQSDLPVSKSIFSGEGDHAQAYGVACRFLLILDRTEHTLAGVDILFASLLPCFVEQKGKAFEAEAMLLQIGTAAREERCEEAETCVLEALSLLERRREAQEALLRDLYALRQILEEWRRLEEALLPRLHAAADLEKNGASASPSRLSQILGELRHSADGTLLKWEKQIGALRLRRE